MNMHTHMLKYDLHIRAKSGHAMGTLNGKEKRSLEDALGKELVDLKQCLEHDVPSKKLPRIACMWNKFYPTWDSNTGLKGMDTYSLLLFLVHPFYILFFVFLKLICCRQKCP
jgi:hypothetical protein